MSGVEPLLIASIVGQVATMAMQPDAPKPKQKDASQLEAESDVRVDKFEKEAKTQNRAAAVEASLTRKSLLGNLGGSSSKLGLNSSPFGSATNGGS